MNKEPLGLYLFRLLLIIGLFTFIVMLYWSSLLIEQDLKQIQNNITQQKNDILGMRSDLDKVRQSIMSGSFNIKNETSSDKTPSTLKSHVDSSYPNLLTEDPFYAKTLPNLLGPNFKPHGIRREATIGKPQNLHPFTNWAQIAEWISLCSISVATQHFGIYETLAPEGAFKMELRSDKDGNPEYWLHLRQDIFWQPLKKEFFAADIDLAPMFFQRHPVTAHDYKFYFDSIMNTHIGEPQAVSLRTYYGDVKEIEVIDDYTLIVRWKTEEVADEIGKIKSQMKYSAKLWTTALRPLASFVYKYFADGSKIITDDANPNTYRTNPVWAQNFSHHWANNIIVSCGPWMFDGFTDREIRFKRNPDYPLINSPLVDSYEIKFKDSPDAIWEEFKTGTLDLFIVPASQLIEVDRFLKSAPYQAQRSKGLGINRLNYYDRSYSYIAWNETNNELFKSKKVRQALTMAIDRKRIIEQNLNGMGVETTGTFYRYSPSYNNSIVPYPYNINKAKELLAEEGWYDSNGDGILDKVINGKSVPFQFKLTYYVKNPNSKSICEYVTTALKEIGIICQMEGVDLADLSAAVDNKSFDALFLAWGLGTPPEDPKQLWYSASSNEKGSSNTIGFSNPQIDAIIDTLTYEYKKKKRLELYHKFDVILYDEAPYVFLYTPKATFVYRDYLQNVFIPAERQDLIPGANVGEPISSIFWIKENPLDESSQL
ncbi:MAG: permease [Parachlamydiaceae bacterium]|nr:permease [Parachlamydiaceae bacterium]